MDRAESQASITPISNMLQRGSDPTDSRGCTYAWTTPTSMLLWIVGGGILAVAALFTSS